MTSIEYRVVVGACVPILLAILGILGKKLTRGPAGSWARSDFYLGTEFCLAGVSVAIIDLFDLLMKPHAVEDASQVASAAITPVRLPAINGTLVAMNVGLVILGFVLFMFVLSLHQQYRNESNVTDARKKELLMLAGLSNVLGCLVLLGAAASLPV
jgi:hypothetical protein